jgi:hypothetical protein
MRVMFLVQSDEVIRRARLGSCERGVMRVRWGRAVYREGFRVDYILDFSYIITSFLPKGIVFVAG